jgi:HEAT repeat protein
MEASNSSPEVKAKLAVAAYAEAWRASTNVVRERMLLNTSRKMAIDMIQRYKPGGDEAVYPLLESSYKNGTDWEEKLGAISTLGALATAEAAQRLSTYLDEFNVKLQRGSLTPDDQRMVRAVIAALGATGQPAARRALNRVLTLDWTQAVKNRATEALNNIRG